MSLFDLKLIRLVSFIALLSGIPIFIDRLRHIDNVLEFFGIYVLNIAILVLSHRAVRMRKMKNMILELERKIGKEENKKPEVNHNKTVNNK